MIERMLIALDESEVAASAADLGSSLAHRLSAQLALVTVVDPKAAVAPDSGVPPDELLQHLMHEAEALLEAVAAQISQYGPVVRRFVRQGELSEQIVKSAQEWRADLLVMGTSGRSGIKRLILGSTAEEVLRQAPCPVLVIPASSLE